MVYWGWELFDLEIYTFSVYGYVVFYPNSLLRWSYSCFMLSFLGVVKVCRQHAVLIYSVQCRIDGNTASGYLIFHLVYIHYTCACKILWHCLLHLMLPWTINVMIPFFTFNIVSWGLKIWFHFFMFNIVSWGLKIESSWVFLFMSTWMYTFILSNNYLYVG